MLPSKSGVVPGRVYPLVGIFLILSLPFLGCFLGVHTSGMFEFRSSFVVPKFIILGSFSEHESLGHVRVLI